MDVNDTTMLHGLYGGEDGRLINADDFVVYGYIIYDTVKPHFTVTW